MREPKYRRHTLRDFAFVEIGGKRKRLPGAYRSDESLAAYHEICARLRRTHGSKVPEPEPSSQDELTVYELACRYMKHCEAMIDATKRCHAANDYAAAKRFAEHVEFCRVSKFGPKKLRDYQQAMAAATKTVGDKQVPLSRSYVNSHVSRVKAMFKWGVSEELVSESVWNALLTVPELKRGKSKARDALKKQPVPAEHIDPVLPFMHEPTRQMVELHRLTGVRSRSLCLAKPEQFDTSVTPWLWRPRHKTEHLDRELIVPLGPRARKLLKPILRLRKPGEYLFQPRDVRKDYRYREHYDAGSYRLAVIRAIARYNRARKKGQPEIPDWHPHRLRHTVGTLVHDGYGYEAAQAILGHDTDITKLYTARRLSLASKIAAEIG